MKKSNDIHKFKLGVFTILGISIFVFVIYLVGNKQGLFSKTNFLYAKFSYVSGLQQGNNVRYLGVNVGTVKKITLINDTTIVAEMSIDNKTFPFIKKDALANIGSDGIVGNMIVNIVPGKGNFANVKSGDTINSFNNVKLDDMLRTLSETNENIVILSSDLLKITKQITEGKGTIGTLLNDTIMANDAKESIAQVKKSVIKLNQIMGNVDAMIKSLDNDNNVIGILKDTIIPGKIHGIVDNIAVAGNELQLTVQKVNEFVSNATEGDGILNHIINDPNLVLQFDSIITNVNHATYNLNQNLEALKHNFLFKRYFKNLEKEESKNK